MILHTTDHATDTAVRRTLYTYHGTQDSAIISLLSLGLATCTLYTHHAARSLSLSLTSLCLGFLFMLYVRSRFLTLTAN